ncbi:MAG: hypothetical protein WC246_00390 [Candidatus Paceibacterota bacterium]|jgi:amino acid transporter
MSVFVKTSVIVGVMVLFLAGIVSCAQADSFVPFPLTSPQAQKVAPLANDAGMGTPPMFTSLGGAYAFFEEIIRWTYTIFFVAAVFFILLAAYYFIVGGSSEAYVEKAKNQLKYAVIAIVVALLAQGSIYVLTLFLTNGA